MSYHNELVWIYILTNITEIPLNPVGFIEYFIVYSSVSRSYLFF